MTKFNNETNVINQANYILENHSTIRATAAAFNIPKSTIHHNLSTKLRYINFPLYKEVKKLLNQNFNLKHIHGGESTRIKYQKLKKIINKNDEIEAIL